MSGVIPDALGSGQRLVDPVHICLGFLYLPLGQVISQGNQMSADIMAESTENLILGQHLRNIGLPGIHQFLLEPLDLLVAPVGLQQEEQQKAGKTDDHGECGGGKIQGVGVKGIGAGIQNVPGGASQDKVQYSEN